jgi:cytidylate kinase
MDVNLADLSRDIRQRDERDATRPVAPLRPAADAVVIDSTTLTIDEVVARVVELGYEKIPAIRFRPHS